jgi:hypothetical protein
LFELLQVSGEPAQLTQQKKPLLPHTARNMDTAAVSLFFLPKNDDEVMFNSTAHDLASRKTWPASNL